MFSSGVISLVSTSFDFIKNLYGAQVGDLGFEDTGHLTAAGYGYRSRKYRKSRHQIQPRTHYWQSKMWL